MDAWNGMIHHIADETDGIVMSIASKNNFDVLCCWLSITFIVYDAYYLFIQLFYNLTYSCHITSLTHIQVV